MGNLTLALKQDGPILLLPMMVSCSTLAVTDKADTESANCITSLHIVEILYENPASPMAVDYELEMPARSFDYYNLIIYCMAQFL